MFQILFAHFEYLNLRIKKQIDSEYEHNESFSDIMIFVEKEIFIRNLVNET